MSYQPSESVKRTQKILESIEERKVERAQVVSDIERMKVKLEAIDRSLGELRTQFEVEIEKFDHELKRKQVFHQVGE